MFLSRCESPDGNIYATAETEDGALAHVLRWIKSDLDQSRFALPVSYFRTCHDALAAGDVEKFLGLWNAVSKNYYGVTRLGPPIDRPLEAASEALPGSIDKLPGEGEKVNHEAPVDSVFEELGKKT